MKACYINIEEFKMVSCQNYLKIFNVKGVDDCVAVMGNKELKAIVLADDNSYVKPCYLINPNIEFTSII